MSAAEQVPVITGRARWMAILFYYAPLVLALALALYLATAHGDYDSSLRDLYAFFAFLGPDYRRPDIDGMYGINGIARRIAYLVQYGTITLLLVRALQAGAPRLRKRSIVAAILLGIAFIAIDNTVRNHSPGRHGGWDDILLSFIAVTLTIVGVVGFFALKSWERHHLMPPAPNSPVD